MKPIGPAAIHVKLSEKGDEIRTPNLKCPACNTMRLHTAAEWKKYHPHAGKGRQADTSYITGNKLKK